MSAFSVVMRRPTAAFSSLLLAAVLGFGLFFDHLSNAGSQGPQLAGLREELPQPVQQLARWSVARGDHGGLPFLVVDKSAARMYAFSARGDLVASSAVLLSAHRLDEPGLATTPAGRFVAAARLGSDGLVWANTQAALLLRWPGSQHAPGRAALRLASHELDDRRISDGSMYVEPAFFAQHLLPLHGQESVAYVLPESQPFDEVFPHAMHAARELPRSPL